MAKDLYEYFKGFHAIGTGDYALLSNRFRTKKFKKGDVLVVPGQIQRELYFVKSGVQMSYVDADGKPQVIAFTYCPNVCAIPESFSFQEPSTCFLTCLTDSQLDCISYDELQHLFDLSQPMERLFRRMTEFLLAGTIKRHIDLHTLTIEQRYKTFCQRSPHLLRLVAHKYISSYLGIDPTNFSKLFNNVRF